ncbi:TIGR01440 family protein [Paenibacillus motobuensis]|uniref:TIGR01440 family protein n=1 Tax=Paenibacillus TaxID=44249 RepID=UPI00203F4673|nr:MULTISPECIES: TIGR01440 family protein [Paenibacillus]MCM3040990.1 TIGR01440 family protein [Paenibacillus lutimineralis]MCM3648094.1 TIGR01440 family protein [Paenibacillus motobuensis]
METKHIAEIEQQIAEILEELCATAKFGPGHLLVVGASTSEVAGQRIGTAGAEEVAADLYAGIERVRSNYGFDVAFQCCEHLNRALVVERAVLDRLRLTEVSAVPVRKAGGSMAAFAYRQLQAPCLVESIEAHGGIDIGETLIGMHLRRVAIPFRSTRRNVGEARVTAAWTRPKLIGGERAVYQLLEASDSNLCD